MAALPLSREEDLGATVGSLRGPLPPEPEQLRRVLGQFPTGVIVATALDRGEPVGMTFQAFASVSFDPPLVLLCPSRTSTSWPRLQAAGEITLNVLAEDQATLARKFAVSGADKFDGVEWRPSGLSGAPILAGATAVIHCTIAEVHEAGDHWVVICAVRTLVDELGKTPLVFVRSGFRRLGEQSDDTRE